MKRLSKAFYIITDVLFAVVMCFLIIFIVFAFSAKFSGGVPTFFGHAYVRVMSGSMSKDGIKHKAIQRGDIAILEKLYVQDIEVGDIIAFYYKDGTYAVKDKTGEVEQKNYRTGDEVFEGASIIFHEVQKIVVDENGQTWFQTKGTNNTSADPYIRGDHVIGRYVDSSLAGFLKFIASPTGIIVIVVIPSAIVCLCLLFEIIDTIDKMIQIKRIAAALPTVSGLLNENDQGEGDLQEGESPPSDDGPPDDQENSQQTEVSEDSNEPLEETEQPEETDVTEE